jgi:hypothetical protein
MSVTGSHTAATPLIIEGSFAARDREPGMSGYGRARPADRAHVMALMSASPSRPAAIGARGDRADRRDAVRPRKIAGTASGSRARPSTSTARSPGLHTAIDVRIAEPPAKAVITSFSSAVAASAPLKGARIARRRPLERLGPAPQSARRPAARPGQPPSGRPRPSAPRCDAGPRSRAVARRGGRGQRPLIAPRSAPRTVAPNARASSARRARFHEPVTP